MAELKMVIWDVDGTIADTERYGHLPACNEAMRRLGLDIEWSWAEFREMIPTIPGNANRLRHVLTQKGYGEAEIKDYVERFTPLKKELYIERYLGEVRLRPGVRRLMRQMRESGLRLAVISTSHEAQIEALLRRRLPEVFPHIEWILGKETGRKTRSDGLLHRILMNRTGLQPDELLMIEDAEDGLQAARAAGIETIVCYNDYTRTQRFDGALAVVPTLGPLTLDSLIAFFQTIQTV